MDNTHKKNYKRNNNRRHGNRESNELSSEFQKLNLNDYDSSVIRDRSSSNVPRQRSVTKINEYHSIIKIFARDELMIDKLCLLNFSLSKSMYEMMKSHLPSKKRLVQLRLMTNKSQFSDWSKTQAQIYINKSPIKFDAENGSRKDVIDITNELIKRFSPSESKISFSIEIKTRSLNAHFVNVELIHPLTLEEIMNKVIVCNNIASSLSEKFKDFRSCEICSKGKALYRCSKCKIAWYCGILHQNLHWSVHKHFCSSENLLKSETKQRRNLNVDCYMETASIISARCPLSRKKIKIPVKGIDCSHAQCYDLRSLLDFNRDKGDLKCPVCRKPQTIKTLKVNMTILEALKRISDATEEIKLYRNGDWEEIRKEKTKRDEIILLE